MTSATVVGGSFAGFMTAISLACEGIEVMILKKTGEIRPHLKSGKVTMLDGGMNGFLFGSILDIPSVSSSKNHLHIGCAWYDNSRNDLFRRLGCIEREVVSYKLNGADIPEATLHELIDQASEKWPEPWASVTIRALKTRHVTGISIKEYVPNQLVHQRIALVGDAAHVPAPITASRFNESLQDAVALGNSMSKKVSRNHVVNSLKQYESDRLSKVRYMVQSGHSFSQSFG